jgi:Flp pilus assembly protein TadD
MKKALAKVGGCLTSSEQRRMSTNRSSRFEPTQILLVDHNTESSHGFAYLAFVHRTQSVKGLRISTYSKKADKTYRLAAGPHYIERLDAGGEPYMQERGARGQCIYPAAAV